MHRAVLGCCNYCTVMLFATLARQHTTQQCDTRGLTRHAIQTHPATQTQPAHP